MQLTEFNSTAAQVLQPQLYQCCAAQEWVDQLLARRPYSSATELLSVAEDIWYELSESQWLNAFDAHPKIGDTASLKEKYKDTLQLAQSEQARVAGASDKVLYALAEYNQQYLEKFGFIFIVCATGKSAEQMLDIVKSRIINDRATELKVAATEQLQITAIRLKQLIGQES